MSHNGWRRSVGARARELDHLRPLGDLGAIELIEFLEGVGDDLCAETRDALLDVGEREDAHHFAIELRDDLARRI